MSRHGRLMAKIGAAFPGGDTDRRRQWRGGGWVRFGLDYRPVPDATGDLERRIGATGVAFRRRIGGGTRRRSKLPRLGSVLDGCLACRTPAAARVRRCARLGAQARLARDIRRHCAAEGCSAAIYGPPASRTALQRLPRYRGRHRDAFGRRRDVPWAVRERQPADRSGIFANRAAGPVGDDLAHAVRPLRVDHHLGKPAAKSLYDGSIAFRRSLDRYGV